MESYYLWFSIALVIGVAEMFTGTFYLLIIALGCVGGGAAAWLGFELPAQLATTALISVLGWTLLRRSGIGSPAELRSQENPDVLLDIGTQIEIEQWQHERRTQVRYRGASWAVELVADASDSGAPGSHTIQEIRGNTLLVKPVKR